MRNSNVLQSLAQFVRHIVQEVRWEDWDQVLPQNQSETPFCSAANNNCSEEGKILLSM